MFSMLGRITLLPLQVETLNHMELSHDKAILYSIFNQNLIYIERVFPLIITIYSELKISNGNRSYNDYFQFYF